MNYRIIVNEQALLDFIDWLPDLQPSEKIYVSLLARNKYLEDKTLLKSDKVSLKRFSTKKEYLLDKLKQLEIPLGCYKQGDVEVPQTALSVYCTINPRCMEKATKQALIKFANVITAPYNGYDPNALVLSEIQQACSRRLYYDIDFDGVSVEDTVYKLKEFINLDCLTILKTRGGFHCLLEFAKLDKRYEKSWYKNISKIEGADISNVDLQPIVGCYQGGFSPEIISIT